ncbi:MAG: transketolase C-terminal domain-containing protein [Solobacterium sp.]|nr:transketolase C-terminal domain-containing protein [Solobacterium sp.]
MTYNTITLRELIGDMLNEVASTRDDIYVIDSDLAKSTTTNKFETLHKEHFVETGIAEQNAMSIAAGIAREGKVPFYVNFAMFVSGTAWTQLRQICYAKENVKLIATHPGMDGGYDGATHHANEDIALMRVLPNLRVLVPSNPDELRAAINLALEYDGPVYIRCVRDSVPNLPATGELAFGKSTIVKDLGDDFALVYEGTSADLAFRSFEEATKQGLKGKLVNVFSIKPFDTETILSLAQSVGKIVTVENHSVLGGLGSLVAETISPLDHHGKLYRVGVNDVFTESGPSKDIKEKYGLNVENVLNYIKK